MFACKEGHLDTVKLLLDYNADTELRNKVNVDGIDNTYTSYELLKKNEWCLRI